MELLRPYDTTDKYKKKVDFAIHLLQSIPQDGEIELAYSSGKDSDVILELAKMAGIPFRAIYKNTTIDPPHTIQHCKENGVDVLQPKMSFLELVKKKGLPTRRARFCCEVLKEYKVCDRAIQGVRRAESTARAKRYKEPEICRTYSAKEKVRVYLPILEWTNDDVERFINERGIKCHPLYYNMGGVFHVERRLGCIGCPMKSDNGVSDYLKYPKLLKQIVKAEQVYFDTHTHTNGYKTFGGSAYNAIFHNLFTNSYDEYEQAVTGGLFPETAIDTKDFLENYFKIDLSI